MTKDNPETANPYKDTIFLPSTAFPMRGGLPQQEPARIAKWEREKLYEQLRARAKGRPAFVLHDGPPYANGNIHIGTGMNKILKDLVVRSRQMMGFDADYIPGWDCHGLPIEWKVEEAFRANNKQKRDVPMAEFRKACRDFAQHWIDVQRSEFKRLGVMGNWNDPYLTMAYSSEAATVKEFLKVAMSDQLKRGAKPVMWSPVEQTALAEAEIEYEERKATTIWVKFPVLNAQAPDRLVTAPIEAMHREDLSQLIGSSIVIWTTTPWTIPANRAISYSRKIAYGLYEVVEMPTAEELGFPPWAKAGDRLIVADARAESVRDAAKIKSWVRRFDVDPSKLDCSHPLKHAGLGGYQFDVPLFEGDHVTDEAGTGFVHTAPGHGDDDYEVWMRGAPHLAAYDTAFDASIPDTVDEFGRYTKACPGFEGLEIIRLDGKKRGEDGPANKAVMDKLIEAGNLLARGFTTLRDAHSWRSKAPVIRRATAQWFISMDVRVATPFANGKTLRQLSLDAIAATTFTPERGRERLRSMVADRPDWLISRQRAWGVPLTLFVNKDTGDILKDAAVNARIVEAVVRGGADAWFGAEAAVFLGDGYDASKYDKVNDILDVWFDSGTTHAFTLEDRGYAEQDSKTPPADLYLEGSDQHRGWFQSSLLESCATRGHAPYKSILTHGFVQAEDGEKMSKSLGNVISPMEVCDKFGADIMRVWVASSDYWDDPSFGWNLFTANSDAYRKLRNTLRYLLGALDGFNEEERVDYAQMPGLERWVLHRLAELDTLVRDAYTTYDFKAAFHALMKFCVVDLSAVYFDIRKDRLYCDAPGWTERRACRTVMDEVFKRLVVWFAPVMVFTCEEAWEQRYPGAASVHLELFPETPARWLDEKLGQKWQRVFAVRSVVTGALEAMRRDKIIGSSLEASVTLSVPDEGVLQALSEEDPAEIFITSHVEPVVVQNLPVGEAAHVITSRVPPDWIKCARSWRYFDPRTADPAFPDISPRDARAVREYRGLA